MEKTCAISDLYYFAWSSFHKQAVVLLCVTFISILNNDGYQLGMSAINYVYTLC